MDKNDDQKLFISNNQLSAKTIKATKNKLNKSKSKENNDSDDEVIYSDDENPIINSQPQKASKLTNDFINKKRKRSEIRNFKNNPHYISDTADAANSKSLWGNEKPLALEELTLNIMPDDEGHKKSKLVWDQKKRNFIMGQKDSQGNIIKKNEAGVRVKKGEKMDAYKKWSKKNKIKIQGLGEIENKTVVDNASTFFNDRRLKKNSNTSKLYQVY